MSSFPTAGLVPTAETLADAFLARFPRDGRGVVVAILDTGVDPGAAGLQTTSDGRPKIVDLLDATGSGDVDTSLVLEPADGKLTLPSGKKITLNAQWTPSADGKYHVGNVAGYDLFPRPLADRVKRERRDKFDVRQREAVNHVQRQLAAWGEQHAATTSDARARRAKRDLLARAAQLEELAKSYSDPGPVYDAVVFFDGEHWRAALDVTESGDFTGVKALTNFRVEREYATFSTDSQFNYALNIYDDGNTLSVVSDSGSHGTHVAAIVAANHPNQPACNGVAPGAQLISVKIGDSRLDAMETTAAMSRAVAAMIEAKCDIINMSFGEFATEHNTGRAVELLKELVDEHNVTFVCIPHNHGPALGTVCSPGGTSSHSLSVGAYVSQQMMEAQYVTRKNDLPGFPYTWSSRGPTFDGALGVDVCAPGGAISAVPNWTLNKKQLMNGTSMAAPNCAGNVALMVSALKDKGIAYTPYSIRRAFQLTAIPIENVEVSAQGKGLIQVLPAFEYLEKQGNQFDGSIKHPLYYEISAACGGYSKARGVFLRDATDFEHDSTEVNVKVKPIFHKNAAPEDKVHFELLARLTPTARWLDVGSNVAIMQEGLGFNVLVNTKHLSPGEHFAEIIAYDANNESRGAVFTIPVSIIKPQPVTSPVIVYRKSLLPGSITRRFLTPPTDATWADVIISRASASGFDGGEREIESNAAPKLFVLHVMQFQPFVRQADSQLQTHFWLRPGGEVCYSLDVVGGLTSEFCVAQYWNQLGDSKLQIEIRFHGIVPDQKQIMLTGGEESHKVLLWSGVQKETIAPSVSFTTWSRRLRPTSSAIRPLTSSLDKFPDERKTYALDLTYSFTVKEAGKVTPRLPLLTGRLYESPFESQLSLVFDDKKHYIGASDAYGDAITLLNMGTYTIKTQIRHEDASKLENLKQTILRLDVSIKEATSSVYGHQDDVALGRKALTEATLNVGKHLAVFIGEPSANKLPAGHSPGDVLTGKIHFGKQKGNVQGSGRRPGGFPISYVIPPVATPTKQPEPEAPKDDRDEQQQADEAVRDLLLSRLTKLVGKPEFPAAYKRILEQFPSYAPILQAHLHHVDDEKSRAEQLSEVIVAADALLAKIDQDDLARFLGTRSVEGDDLYAHKKAVKEKKSEKEWLLDAMARKTRALGDAGKWDEFTQSYKTLEKWVDIDTPKYPHISLLHDTQHDALGLKLQRLRKAADLDAAERDTIISEDNLAKQIQETLKELGWTHWLQHEQQLRRVKELQSFRRF